MLQHQDRGASRVDLTDDIAKHPDFDPEFDNYPSENSPGKKTRYATFRSVKDLGELTKEVLHEH